jgi:hypothetical protein
MNSVFVVKSKRNSNMTETEPLTGRSTDEEDIELAETNLYNITGSTSIIIESYDKCFSYFDKRRIDDRSFSEDFILECNNRMKENSTGGMDLNIFIPHENRHFATEKLITERLRAYYQQEHQIETSRLIRSKLYALVLTVIGLMLLACSSLAQDYFTVAYSTPKTVTYVYDVVAWYVFWTSFDHVYYNWDNNWTLAQERKRTFVVVKFAAFKM